jgi:hypothetical protein
MSFPVNSSLHNAETASWVPTAICSSCEHLKRFAGGRTREGGGPTASSSHDAVANEFRVIIEDQLLTKSMISICSFEICGLKENARRSTPTRTLLPMNGICWRSRYRDWLPTGRDGSEIESRWCQEFSLLHAVQADFTLHPVMISCV